MPHRFPFIIGGEVNFKPKGIDFDISRSNILSTNKSLDFQREISVALRPLFKQGILSENTELKRTILNYLCFYLSVFDREQGTFDQTHLNFYTKEELIEICLTLWELPFGGTFIYLKDAIKNMLTH